ncbi:CoA pyrophosphatase [Desulfosarcina sp. OttesenSCG-928-B08]|nr:CoA pyrophosphatase [Desulfosarcina sp. OttesenSCG-928-B08]
MTSIPPLICDAALCRHLRANLDRFDRSPDNPVGGKALKPSAVGLVIVGMEKGAHPDGTPEMPDRAAMILTRRAYTLRTHAGQWALPGGRMEAGETPEKTVLRELAEEVGLALSPDRIIGRLDDYSTRSGFTIKPVVIWGGRHVSLTPNPGEVSSIHRIPLTEFLRKDAPQLESIPESPHPVLLMPVGNTCIAAPTAALLYQFREVAILGKTDIRVDHFEQPHFAWQ